MGRTSRRLPVRLGTNDVAATASCGFPPKRKSTGSNTIFTSEVYKPLVLGTVRFYRCERWRRPRRKKLDRGCHPSNKDYPILHFSWWQRRQENYEPPRDDDSRSSFAVGYSLVEAGRPIVPLQWPVVSTAMTTAGDSFFISVRH